MKYTPVGVWVHPPAAALWVLYTLDNTKSDFEKSELFYSEYCIP